MELPMPFNQLAAQARGLELVVPCLARAGGVVVYYPLSMAKGDI
ncbi:major capsid family protein [Achromobacter xylosoxidans]